MSVQLDIDLAAKLDELRPQEPDNSLCDMATEGWSTLFEMKLVVSALSQYE